MTGLFSRVLQRAGRIFFSSARAVVKYAIIIVFAATFGIAIAAGVVAAGGHRDIAERYLGPIFLMLWGILFAGAMLWVIATNTPAGMIFFGEVSRDRKPLAWYIPIFAIFALGVGVFFLGLVLLIGGQGF